jgi:prepilin peptidase CpaA
MPDFQSLTHALGENWPIWVVTITLIVAAVIDGMKLKVPNWITFPMIISGWIYMTLFSPYAGWEGLLYSLGGTVVGLAVLMPAYAIGGMGAGDVKLMAGVGAWVGATVTLWAFAISAIIGGVIAVVMVIIGKGWSKHQGQFWMICNEILTVKDPDKLASIAAERKPTMMLLPYGIPIAIGTIAYFACTGMLL